MQIDQRKKILLTIPTFCTNSIASKLLKSYVQKMGLFLIFNSSHIDDLKFSINKSIVDLHLKDNF